jgi:hypothetical protein
MVLNILSLDDVLLIAVRYGRDAKVMNDAIALADKAR